MDLNRIQSLFEAAAALPMAQRDGFLKQECGTDAELRAEIEALLGVADSESLLPDQPLMSAWDDRAVDALLGSQIGVYRLERLLGRGGMGAVFLGTRVDDEVDMNVSIKVMQPQLVSSAGMKRFRRERQLLADLRHPYIAGLLDAGSLEADQPYIIIEYIDGETIDRWRETHRPDLADLLVLFRKFAEAVAFAHAKGVIHRDIKPGNLMVTHGGVPKLLDFGIAALRRRMTPVGNVPQTAADGAMTPMYASPEQADGRTVNEATDLFSLGVVLLECLLGESPRDWGGAPIEMITGLVADRSSRSAVHPDAPAHPGVNDEVPEALGHVLRQALQPDPARRYQEAEQLIADLDRVIASLSGGTMAAGDQAVYDVFLWHNREPAAFALADRLDRLGLRVFPSGGEGRSQRDMAEAAAASRWCLVCLGENSPPWQADPVGRDLLAFRGDRLQILPLLLPGTPFPNRRSRIPRFLRDPAWFTFDEGLQADRIAALAQQLRGDETQVGTRSDLCPFRGLEVFREQDSDFFIGREAVAQRIVAYLGEHPMIGVLGPSGSGKSSVVQAGVLPALRRGGDTVVLFKPGRRPLEAMAFAVADAFEDGDRRVAGGVLAYRLRHQPQALHAAVSELTAERDGRFFLVIDQFEELFTLGADSEAAAAFVQALVFALEHPRRCCGLILTMRSDFLGYFPQYPSLNTLLLDHLLQLEPMSSDDLRRAITVPARMVGVKLEPGLSDRILAEVIGAPGKLPLLAHTMLELFQRRDGGRLTLAAYNAVGGIEGALAHRAEAEYQALEEGAQAVLRHIFTHHLIHIGEAGENTRRTALRAELQRIGGSPATVNLLLSRWTEARLLTAYQDPVRGEELIDVAHEALIRRWPRIAEWLAEDREAARHLNNLRRQARAWQDAGRDQDHLLRGGLLLQMNTLVTHDHTSAGTLVEEFVATSWALEARRQAHEARVRVRLMQHKNLALVAGGVALLLATIAFVLYLRADRAEVVAVAAEGEAKRQSEAANLVLSGMYVKRSGEALDEGRPDHALFYSLAALANEIPADESVPAAVGRFADPRMAGAERLLWHAPVGVPHQATALSGDGAWLAVAGYDHIIRVTATAGLDGRGVARPPAMSQALSGHRDRINALVLSHNGRLMVSAGDDRQLRFWEEHQGEMRARTVDAVVDIGRPIQHLVLSRTGRLVVAATDRGDLLWVPVAETRKKEVVRLDRGPVRCLAMAPKGSLVACATDDGAVMVTGHDRSPLVLAENTPCRDLLWLPSGLVAVKDDGGLLFWTAPNRRKPEPPQAFTMHECPILAVTAAGAGGVWGLGGCGNLSQYRLGAAEKPHRVRVCDPLRISPKRVDLFRGGGLLALAIPDLPIQLHRADGGELLAREVGHTDTVWSVDVSPDGSTLVSSGNDHHIKLWDTATGHNRADIRLSGLKAAKAQYSPDGETIVVTTFEGPLVILDAGLNERLILPGHEGLVYTAVFSPDGSVMASSGADHTVRLWDMRQEPVFTILGTHRDDVRRLAFSPDGRILASLANDKSMAIWDVANRRQLAGFDDVDTNRIAIAFAPDGKRLIWSTIDHAVQMWDIAPHLESGRWERPGRKNSRFLETDYNALINAICFSPNGRRFATSTNDGTISLWAYPSGRLLDQFIGHDMDVTSLAFSPDGKSLVSSAYDGRIRMWRTDLRILAGAERVETGTVGDLAVSPDGMYFAASTLYQAVHVWRNHDGRLEFSFRDFDTHIRAVAFSPDGKFLTAAGSNSRLYFWSLQGGETEVLETVHDDGATQIAYSPCGSLMATGGGDGDLIIWDAEQRVPLQRFERHSHLVRDLAFSPDSALLASISFNAEVLVWDVVNGCLNAALSGHSGYGANVGWSPDGRLLATASSDKVVRLWDVEGNRPPILLAGHRNAVEGLAFGRYGRTLVTADIEGGIVFWDLHSREILARVDSPGYVINPIVRDPRSSKFASVLHGREIGFWHPDRLSFFLSRPKSAGGYRALLRTALHRFGYRFEGATFIPEPGLTLAPVLAPSGVTASPRPAHQALLPWLVSSSSIKRDFGRKNIK